MDPDEIQQDEDPTLQSELEIQQQQQSAVDEDSPEAMRQRLNDMLGKKEEPKEEVKPEVKADPKKAEAPSTEKPTAKKGSDGMTKEERAALLDYKSKAETAETRIKELEAKVASGDATAKEAAELKTKVADWERKYGEKEAEMKGWLEKQDPIALERVRMSELYQQEVVVPSSNIEKEITEICKGYDVNPEAVINAHYNKDRVARNKALAEMKSTMDDESKVELTDALRRLAQIDAKEQEIARRPQDALAEIKEREEQKTRLTKEREAASYKRADEAVYQNVVLEEFPELKADPAMSSRVREKATGIDWGNITPEKKAYLAHGAFLAIEYRDAMKKLRQENEQLRASVDKVTRKPGMETTHKEERKAPTKGDETKEPQTIEEHFALFRNGQHAAASMFG